MGRRAYRGGKDWSEAQESRVRLMLMRQRYTRGHKFEPWDDTVIMQARRALGLTGNRYPKSLAREATLPSGLRVRVTPSKRQDVARSGTARIQFFCPHDQKWWPAGRYSQHVVVHYPVGARMRTRSR